MSVVCTYHCRGVKGGGGASSEVGKANHSTSLLLIFTTEKVTKGAELQFLCTQGTLQGERVEDHRMIFTRHLHLLQ